jgi:hypothetical protein
MSLLIDDYKKFIELDKKKKQLKSELKEVEKNLQSLESILTDNLLNNDISKFTIGDRTVYITKQIWASVSDQYKAVKLLKQAGYGDYVQEKYNANQLSRLLRDLDEQEVDIPSEFKGVIEPLVKTSLRVVKA